LRDALSKSILVGVAVTYAEVLARNVRAARSRKGLDQESLAARMRALGHAAWRRQTVANVDKGKRRLTAEEILGLALALETTIATLMAPTGDDRAVDFPTGTIDVESVQALAMGYNTEPITWDADKPSFAGAETPRRIADQMPWRYSTGMWRGRPMDHEKWGTGEEADSDRTSEADEKAGGK
jgi:transcriptional regulator with XRE-family HTH domain